MDGCLCLTRRKRRRRIWRVIPLVGGRGLDRSERRPSQGAAACAAESSNPPCPTGRITNNQKQSEWVSEQVRRECIRCLMGELTPIVQVSTCAALGLSRSSRSSNPATPPRRSKKQSTRDPGSIGSNSEAAEDDEYDEDDDDDADGDRSMPSWRKKRTFCIPILGVVPSASWSSASSDRGTRSWSKKARFGLHGDMRRKSPLRTDSNAALHWSHCFGCCP